jgi:hypothetical protein
MQKRIPFPALLVLFFPLFFSCKKTENHPSDPDKPLVMSISGVNPSNPAAGSLLTIQGRGFGTDTSRIKVTLNGQPVQMLAINDTSIKITIPANILTGGSQTFTLELEDGPLILAQTQITVHFAEPKGWFYASYIPISAGGSSPIFKQIIFPTDSIGYVVREKYLYRTVDGAETWKGDNNNGGLGFGNAVSSTDGNHVWNEVGVDIFSSTDGTTWSNSQLDTISTIPGIHTYVIEGLYMSSATNGQLMTPSKLFYINGSFAPKDISPEYQSIYSSSDASYRRLSNVDELNLMIAGFATIGGATQAIIVQEKAGTFTEYPVSVISTAGFSLPALQLVDANTAYLADGNNDIFKMTGPANWARLNQKATALYFKDANNGYAAYNGIIYQTSDGGSSWQTAFTLRTGETIHSMTGRNGKIWALGNDATQGIIVKFNP